VGLEVGVQVAGERAYLVDAEEAHGDEPFQYSLGENTVAVGLGLLGRMACQFSGLAGAFPWCV